MKAAPMRFTLVGAIGGSCWVYRDALGNTWLLGFPLA